MKFLKRLINWFDRTKEVNNDEENKTVFQTKRECEYVTIDIKNEECENYNKELENLRAGVNNEAENKAIEDLIVNAMEASNKKEEDEGEGKECINRELTNNLENRIVHKNDKIIDRDIFEEPEEGTSLGKKEDIETNIFGDKVEYNIELEENKETKLKTKSIARLVSVLSIYSREKTMIIEGKNRLNVIAEAEKQQEISKFQILLKQYAKLQEEKNQIERHSTEETNNIYINKDDGLSLILENNKEYKNSNKPLLTLIETSNNMGTDLNRTADEYYSAVNYDSTNSFSEYGNETYQGELGKIKIFEALTTEKKLSSINIKTWNRYCRKAFTNFAIENMDELEILIYTNLDAFTEAYKENNILLHRSWYRNPVLTKEKMYEDITFIFRYSENYLREKKGNTRKLSLNYTNKLIENINDYLEKNSELAYTELEKKRIDKKITNQKSKKELAFEEEIEKLIDSANDDIGFDISLDVELKDMNNGVKSIKKKGSEIGENSNGAEKLDLVVKTVGKDNAKELDEIIKGVDDFII